jgi:hypothetical protein
MARIAILLCTVGALLACGGPAISKFDETAYQKATSLKVESLALMDSATEPYDEHADRVRQLEAKLEKALEYAENRPDSQISTQQWELLTDEDEDLLGGFLERWENDSTLNEAFVEEKKKQVRKAFDTIIDLESGKIKPKDVQGGQQ